MNGAGLDPYDPATPIALVVREIGGWACLDRMPVVGSLIDEGGEHLLRVDYVLAGHGGIRGVRVPCGVTVVDRRTLAPIRKHDGHETATTVTYEVVS